MRRVSLQTSLFGASCPSVFPCTIVPSSTRCSPFPDSCFNNTLRSSLLIPSSRSYHSHDFYANRTLDEYASQDYKRVTMKQLCVFGRTLTKDKILQSGNYVRTELPVRLSHRIRDFQNLPFIVGTNPHIEMVYQLYWEAFETLRQVPIIETLDDNHRFCATLKDLLNQHLVVIPQLAMGVTESAEHMTTLGVDKFMNEMLRSRISRRVLAEQHIRLSMDSASGILEVKENQGWIGIVNTKCHAERTVIRCAQMAGQSIKGAYGVEPPVILVDGHVNACFTYIPDHIEYIIYELLKNSMRFTMEFHAEEPTLLEALSKPSTLTQGEIALGISNIPTLMDSTVEDPELRFPPIHSPSISSSSISSSFSRSFGVDSADSVSPIVPKKPSLSSSSSANLLFQPQPSSSNSSTKTLSISSSTPPPSISSPSLTHPSSPIITNLLSSSLGKAPVTPSLPLGTLPSIRVTIAESSSDILFRISDCGGGVSPSAQPHLFSYSTIFKTNFSNFNHIPQSAGKAEEKVSPLLH